MQHLTAFSRPYHYMQSAATHRISAGTLLSGHAHEGVHLCAVLEGGFTETVAKAAVDMGPGQVRLSPGTAHRMQFGAAGAKCLLVDLDATALPALPRSRFLGCEAELAALAREIDRALQRSDSARVLAVDGLVTELTAVLQRRLDGRTTPAPPWLRSVREMLHDASMPLPVRGLAQQAGVHRVYLARVFREHVGVSVSAYSRRLRIERALHLLAGSDLSLADIADHVGFADQSHLTRSVRAAAGTTPWRFRRDKGLPAFKTGRARRA